MILIRINDLSIDHEIRLFAKNNHLIYLLITSHDYLICLFTLLFNYSIYVQYIPSNFYSYWSYLSSTFTLKISDIGFSTLWQDIGKIILKAFNVWKELGFKDISLLNTFLGNFKGFTEEDFKLVNIHDIHKLWDYLQIFGVYIQKL